jgi:hypothetical protein
MGAKKLNPLEKDLEIRVTRMENTTTGTDLLKLTEASPAHRVSALLNKGVKILIPHGNCPVGHFVLVDFQIQMSGKKFEMQATGKVIGEEKVDHSHIVELEFKSFDGKLWNRLFAVIQSRQDQVSELFYKIKGK